jgi:hypothetical protein
MRKPRKLLVVLGVFVAGAALAPSALAAQTMTISDIDEWGFTASASTGWSVRNCTGAAYDSSGAVVDTAWMWDRDGRHAWMEWNGYPDLATVDQVTVDCNLRKAIVTYPRTWRWFTKARRGTDTSSRSRSSSCYFRSYAGSLTLDCWGGSYATASYRFRLPSDARRVARRIVGSVGCCDFSGSIRRNWSGNRATVTVTGWNAYTIDRVKIRYQHKAPTRTVTYRQGTGHGQRFL